MSTFSSKLISGLDAFNEDWAQSRASTGAPQRPEKGEWDNIVSALTVTEDEELRYGDDKVLPAFAVDFKYKLLGGTSALPKEMKQGQEWPGRRFICPLMPVSKLPADMPKGKQQQIRIQQERLKGHLTQILGSAYTGKFAADLQKACELVANPSAAIGVRVACNYNTDGDKTYFEEYIQRRLA